jgi:hypothetical protein
MQDSNDMKLLGAAEAAIAFVGLGRAGLAIASATHRSSIVPPASSC